MITLEIFLLTCCHWNHKKLFHWEYTKPLSIIGVEQYNALSQPLIYCYISVVCITKKGWYYDKIIAWIGWSFKKQRFEALTHTICGTQQFTDVERAKILDIIDV